MNGEVRPRVALVTGAAQGIGRAIAIRLAEDGFDVAVNSVSQTSRHRLDELVQKIKAKGRRAIAITADVSKEDEVNEMVETAFAELGGLDVMVANAGVGAVRSILETTEEEWDQVYGTNVKGTLWCYKAAARIMIEHGIPGKLIGASSIYGKTTDPLWSTFGGSKIAIRSLTQAAAAEFGKFGITANCYAPGMTNTPAMVHVGARINEIMQVDLDDFKEMVNQMTPLGRFAEAEDIARVVGFLASKDSDFISGQTFNVDGGMRVD